MNSDIKCNCYINGMRKPKSDRKKCTDVKKHIWNKQIDDYFVFADDSDEDSDEDSDGEYKDSVKESVKESVEESDKNIEYCKSK
jgi:hypothetical protein